MLYYCPINNWTLNKFFKTNTIENEYRNFTLGKKVKKLWPFIAVLSLSLTDIEMALSPFEHIKIFDMFINNLLQWNIIV